MISLLVFFVLLNCVIGIKLQNCEEKNIHFEKIIGLRPSEFIKLPILFQRRNDDTPITLDCLRMCQVKKDCVSFIIFYEEHKCYWLNASYENQKLDLVTDTGISWFVKVCINGTVCDEKLWKFERIPGATLIGNNSQILSGVTRTDCEQKCVLTKKFECRSMTFRITNTKEYSNPNVIGNCTLSIIDRHTVPNAYRVARDEEEYLENQCAETENIFTSKGQFCAYEEFEDRIHRHKDLMYRNMSQTECQNLCDKLKSFNCRGFSMDINRTSSTCWLHSEDTKVYGPNKILENVKNTRYYEKAKCLNITVSCTTTDVAVTYIPDTNFNGIIYLQGYSSQPGCFSKGRGIKPLSLRVNLHSSNCGIIEAKSHDNRKLLSAPLIIQYNEFVQTQGDRLIRIGCIYGDDSIVLVGTGVTVAPQNSNNGSSLINSTMSVKKNDGTSIQMKLVDHYTKKEIPNVEIGEDLDLLIISEGKSDIWANHLLAMTEKGTESILLLDDRGCSTDSNIFPPLRKSRIGNKTILMTTFQAFKFSSSPIVRFSVMVETCHKTCPEIKCGKIYRQKRISLDSSNGTKITELSASTSEDTNSTVHKEQLDIMITFKNQEHVPDKLVYGSNKVLVAGYNYQTNEVCVDYSLLLGLIISWVLIQIIFVIACFLIIRRYKRYYQNEYMNQAYEEYNKNFGLDVSNLDNRRVRWADNGDEI